MKLINPSFEILEQGPGLQGIYKQIELAGRTCYKSLDKITDDSAEGFVNRMINSKHYAMLEHGTVYLYSLNSSDTLRKYAGNRYSAYKSIYSHKSICQDDADYYEHEYVTTNYRVLVENGWLDDLKYLCDPTEFHEKRVTVRFTTDRGVSHEFVRHRVFSFAQESTRYCNYSKDKFGNELTFIIPSWTHIPEGAYECFEDSNDIFDFKAYEYTNNKATYYGNVDTSTCLFLRQLDNSQEHYMELIKQGWTPQQARQVLPNALKTELVMTGFVSDYQHFFDLRARGATGAPHPDAKALAEPLMHEFKARSLI